MKTFKLFLSITILAIFFTSCKDDAQTEIQYLVPDSITVSTNVDFEAVKLNNQGIWNGSDNSGSFTTMNSIFKNKFDSMSYNGTTTFFWSGFACSSKNDSITAGYGNQYSVIAGSGAFNSKQFALAYDSAALVCPSNTYGNFSIKSLYITNSTYAFLGIKNGDYGVGGFGKKFSTNDWFKVTIKGYKSNIQTSSVDVYLADFRSGKSLVLKNWTKIDLSSLGQVDLVTFTFDSTDKSGGWINTPKYACIDNIEFTQTISTK